MTFASADEAQILQHVNVLATVRTDCLESYSGDRCVESTCYVVIRWIRGGYIASTED